MRRHEFMFGLSGDGVGDTIEAYMVGNIWRVHTMGYNEGGYWILFEAVGND